MSRYRDELDAAKTRAAALEEDLEARDEEVEEQAARIAELEGKLAHAEKAKVRRRKAVEEDDDEEVRAEDDARPVRQRLIKLQPSSSLPGGGILALVLVMLGFIVFLIMILAGR